MNSLLEKLSPRERRLAIAATAMVAVLVVLFFSVRSMQRLNDLDRVIGNLETQLLRNTELAARGVSVDRAFESVAAQHSSEWTPAEIHDRLRREIQRLALQAPDAKPGKSKDLVEIPILRQGSLKDSEQGYREYSLSIRPSPTDIKNIMTFLFRLQSSEQSLRIDGLELSRAPDSQLITANINVTRIIVQGTPVSDGEGSNKEAGSAISTDESILNWNGAAVEPWQAASCDLAIEPVSAGTPDKPENDMRLKATASAPEAEIYLAHSLAPGTYELTADIAASAPAWLQISESDTGKVYEGRQELNPDGNPYKYRVVFSVPKSSGGKANVHAPVIHATDQGAVINVDNLVLIRKFEQ